MQAAIRAIEYYLPERVLSNVELAAVSEHWTAEKIAAKTGIVERRIAGSHQSATDLAYEATRRLFDSGACSADEVDYVLLCTQSPDYFLPSSACLLHERLHLRRSAGAVDFNLGCSGFVYGLGLAKGLIETGQAENVVLITSDTYTKYLRQDDLSVRTLFGDGAAATLVQATNPENDDIPLMGPFCYGTDGRGAPHLIVESGAMRDQAGKYSGHGTRPSASVGDSPNGFPEMYMNGSEVFAFTLQAVPGLVRDVLRQSHTELGEVRWFVFHQANAFMLEHLRKKIGIPIDRFAVSMSHCGNTVSSTIPIALRELIGRQAISPGDRVVLIGFGVGYSWAGTMVRWIG
jgi:3-oxoacyl-[acyl-carrier-protein] synthase-3